MADRPSMGRASACLVAVLAACGADGEPAPAPAPAHPEPVPVMSPRVVTSDGAFDLVASEGGAVFSWGPPAESGGGVRVVALSPAGTVLGEERDVAGGALARPAASDAAVRPVLELVVVSSGPALGVAWIVTTADGPVAEAAVSSAGLDAFGPAFSLGPSGGPPRARGRIAGITGDEGALRVRVQAPSRPCDGGGACEGSTRYRLDHEGRPREGPAEAVPSPCEPFVVGSVATRGTYFHALCAREAGAPQSTVFAIDPDPDHAAAAHLLPGCEPLGLSPTEEGAALVARCPEGVSAAWVDGFGRVLGTARPATRTASCALGRPTLTVSGADASLSLPLTAPLSRIEPLLPEVMAGPRARAVWTGTAILVAERREADVFLSRWECGATMVELRRTDPI